MSIKQRFEQEPIYLMDGSAFVYRGFSPHRLDCSGGMSASGSSELIRSQNILPDPIRAPGLHLPENRKEGFDKAKSLWGEGEGLGGGEAPSPERASPPPNLYSFPSVTTSRMWQTPHTPEDVG